MLLRPAAEWSDILPTLMLFRAALLNLLLLGTLALSAWGAASTPPLAISAEETEFLRDLEQRGVLFFTEHTHPHTGLTQDRAPALGTAGYAPASIAATGFALTSWVVACQNGWMEQDEVLRRTRITLRFLRDEAEHEHGWFYHFLDMETGKRVWRSEASTIDTALLLMGAVTAREFLRDPEINDLVAAIYARVDWTWALNGGATLVHGWRPEGGFIPYRWEHYSELMGMYLLGLGAPANALPESAWHAWSRGPRERWDDFEFIPCSPLFTHQYSHAWFSFAGQRDAYADYWENSVAATLSNRAWCLAQTPRFPSWRGTLWGLTAADGPHGYRAWGAPPDAHTPPSDGTLVPCAAGGSLPFAPRECLDTLLAMQALELEGLWGRYGFADAFNPETGWVSSDVIAIDVGITVIMSHNFREGSIWRIFMQAPEAKRGMELAGFRSTREVRVANSD